MDLAKLCKKKISKHMKFCAWKLIMCGSECKNNIAQNNPNTNQIMRSSTDMDGEFRKKIYLEGKLPTNQDSKFQCQYLINELRN